MKLSGKDPKTLNRVFRFTSRERKAKSMVCDTSFYKVPYGHVSNFAKLMHECVHIFQYLIFCPVGEAEEAQ